VPQHQDLELLAAIWPTEQQQQLQNLLKHEVTEREHHRHLRVAPHSTRFPRPNSWATGGPKGVILFLHPSGRSRNEAAQCPGLGFATDTACRLMSARGLLYFF
jgi:hypothetical protein